jgi:hypothetical protein
MFIYDNNIIYGIKALVIGNLISCIICIIFNKAIWYANINIVLGICLSIAFVMMIIITSIYYTLTKINKDMYV